MDVLPRPTDPNTVHVTLAVDNPLIRRGLLDALRSIGLKAISEVGQFEQLHAVIKNGPLDLLIAVTELGGLYIGNMIKDMRHAEFGAFPFPVVMLLLSDSGKDYVRKVVDCGADDLLLLPVSAGQILARVAVLNRARKSYIVTRDYVGPDRRREIRDGHDVPVIEVPNPLAAKAKGLADGVLKRDMEAATSRLKSLKIERLGVQIRWLYETINQEFRSGRSEVATLSSHATAMIAAARDLERRTRDWQNSPVPEWSRQLAIASKVLEGAHHSPTGMDIGAVTQVAGRIADEIKRALGM